MTKPFATAADALKFAMGGNATVTFVSKVSNTRFTYRIQAPHFEGKEGTNARRNVDSDFRFVSLLNGADNENSFAYIGYVRRGVFFWGNKSKISREAKSVQAFEWVWKNLQRGVITGNTEIWHEGRCGVCGRKLTVPSSIESGIGPECAERVGFFACDTVGA